MNVMKGLYASAGTLAGAAVVLLKAPRASAATEDSFQLIPKPVAIESGLTGKDMFISVVNFLVNWVTLIAGVLAVLYLLWMGIQYITSAGDPAKAKTARAGIINAVIGIIIIIAAFYIIRFAVGLGNEVTTSTNI